MSCHHSNPEHHKYCSTCGEQLQKIMCGCGNANSLHAKFCGLCGQDLAAKKVHATSFDPQKIRLKDLILSKPNTADTVDSDSKAMTQTDIERFFGQ